MIMNRKVKKSVIDWKPISDRLSLAKCNSKFGKLPEIVYYALTYDAEEENKEEFYEIVEEEIRTTPRHDVLMEVVNLNA